MKLVNLTPNSIKLPSGKTIQPSGFVARANTSYEKVGDVVGVPLVMSHVDSISNVPDPKPDTLYIVPTVVRVALSFRDDVVSPCKLIRENGVVVGCSSFETNIAP